MALYGLAAGATVVTLHVYRGGSGRGCGGHGNFTVDVVRCVPSLRPPSLSRPALLRPFDPVPQPLRHFLSGAPHPTGSLLAAPARPPLPPAPGLVHRGCWLAGEVRPVLLGLSGRHLRGPWRDHGGRRPPPQPCARRPPPCVALDRPRPSPGVSLSGPLLCCSLCRERSTAGLTFN